MSDPIVLVVEDEPLLRLDAVSILNEAGLRTVGVRSAEAAIELLENSRSLRAVFTDVDLGAGHDGLWLADAVRKQWPQIGVLVTSGHRHVAEGSLPDGALFVGKPYGECHIICALRQLAD